MDGKRERGKVGRENKDRKMERGRDKGENTFLDALKQYKGETTITPADTAQVHDPG